MKIIDYDIDPIGYLESCTKEMLKFEENELKPLEKIYIRSQKYNYKNLIKIKLADEDYFRYSYQQGRMHALRSVVACLRDIPKNHKNRIKRILKKHSL